MVFNLFLNQLIFFHLAYASQFLSEKKHCLWISLAMFTQKSMRPTINQFQNEIQNLFLNERKQVDWIQYLVIIQQYIFFGVARILSMSKWPIHNMELKTFNIFLEE